jgi:hypothetical protein
VGGVPVPNLTINNTQIPTIQIIARNAPGNVVLLPDGDVCHAESSDTGLKAEIIGTTVKLTPMMQRVQASVVVSDTAGLDPVVLDVTVIHAHAINVRGRRPSPTTQGHGQGHGPPVKSLDLDMNSITYETQPEPGEPPETGEPPVIGGGPIIPPEIEVPPETEIPPSPTGGWTATIEYDGGVYQFDMAAGEDKGGFIAPSADFVQGCVRARNPNLANFFVDFRFDEASDRQEVVFWNGECLGSVPSAYARDLPGYTATIRDSDDTVIHTEEIPEHGWGQRWRWQSAPREIIRTAEDVFADGFLPWMSLKAARIEGYDGLIVPPVPPAVGTYTTFMAPDTASTKLGLVCGVDTGGERAEIGLVTEWQADWLLRGTETSLAAMMQQAEMCAGDWNFYIPDSVTGAFVDYKADDEHYRAHEYQQQAYGNPGQYYQIKWGKQNGWDIHEADSHIPNVFYLAYAATEDPYLLEAMQAIVQYGAGWDIYGRENVYGSFGTRVVCSYNNEIRTLGWGIRNLACAYKATPENAPSWLQPRSVLSAYSVDYLLVIDTRFTKSADHLHSMFYQLGTDPYYQIFEQSYGIMGMALADLVGLPGDWKSQLEFYFGMHENICSATSGWNRQCPQPHDIDGTAGGFNINAKNSWAEFWTAVKSFMQNGASFPNAPSPGNQQGGSMGNCSQIYAACACALSRGVPAAGPAKDWMDEFIDFNYPNNADSSMGISFYAKCGFDGD